MLKHIPSSQVEIFFSRDYSLFKFLPSNRALNQSKIKKIISEIDDGNDMLMYYPIQVKESDGVLWILDGQHRFKVAKFFQKNIFYIIIKEDKTMADIAKVNSNVEKWKMIDFLNCYKKQENKDYEIIGNFLIDYPFGFGCALGILKTGSPGVEGYCAGINEDFKNGLFKVEKYDAAVELAELCKLFSSSELWKSKSFIIAIYRIWKAGLITFAELYLAYSKYPDMLTRQANYKGYVVAFEAIINHKKKNRIVIL